MVLDAPDTVLLERQAGKRVDPETGDVYHTTFDWPQDPSVQERLVEPSGISQDETKVELVGIVVLGFVSIFHLALGAILNWQRISRNLLFLDRFFLNAVTKKLLLVA